MNKVTLGTAGHDARVFKSTWCPTVFAYFGAFNICTGDFVRTYEEVLFTIKIIVDDKSGRIK